MGASMSTEHADADFNTTGAEAHRLIHALSESEALLRSIVQAMGWERRPREEWSGIPDAIVARSERLSDAEARVRRLETTILTLTAQAGT